MSEINLQAILLLADIIMLAKTFRRKTADPERVRRFELAWAKVSEKAETSQRGKI